MKKIISLGLFIAILCFVFMPVATAQAEVEVNAKSALLMEASTGKVLYELNPHEKLPPASITKIMTMLLIMEAIERGEINYDTVVTASERAKSMGGSTMFLDTGEQMTVREMLKGIAIASANDACVAMAEHLSGSIEAFVAQMNEKARQLGMNNTNFVNTTGLDADNHYTTAYDIALMTRELLKHPDIFKFTTIWMESLRGGKTELANTNRLIRFYKGANGMKTGSTSKALYCISATALRDGMQLIAVVLASPTTKDRFASAGNLLNYGFANYAIAGNDADGTPMGNLNVEKGMSESVALAVRGSFSALIPKAKKVQVKVVPEMEQDVIYAPVRKGTKVGTAKYVLDGEEIGRLDIVTAEDVRKVSFMQIYLKILKDWLK